jgi:hypothetical protein
MSVGSVAIATLPTDIRADTTDISDISGVGAAWRARRVATGMCVPRKGVGDSRMPFVWGPEAVEGLARLAFGDLGAAGAEPGVGQLLAGRYQPLL